VSTPNNLCPAAKRRGRHILIRRSLREGHAPIPPGCRVARFADIRHSFHTKLCGGLSARWFIRTYERPELLRLLGGHGGRGNRPFYIGLLINLVLLVDHDRARIPQWSDHRQEARGHQGRAHRRLARLPRADILAAKRGQQPVITMVPFLGPLYSLVDSLHDLRRAAALLPRLHRRHHRHSGLNPAIDTILTAETPEGIAISIRPAGFAVRATAFLIDAVIRFVFLMICATALAAAPARDSAAAFSDLPIRLELALSRDLRADRGGRHPRQTHHGPRRAHGKRPAHHPGGLLDPQPLAGRRCPAALLCVRHRLHPVAQRLAPHRRSGGRHGRRLPRRRAAGRLARRSRPHSAADGPVQAPADRHHGLRVSGGAPHPATRRGDRRARVGRLAGHACAPLAHRSARGRCALVARRPRGAYRRGAAYRRGPGSAAP
jgi:hypothetical protein